MNEPSVLREMLGFPAEGQHTPSPAVTSPGASRSLAVVGLSDDPHKPSHYVSAYMQRAGYRLLPVNPGLTSILGVPAFPSLRDLPEAPEIVNVFRLPRYLPALVDEMIVLGFRNLWVQLGIVNLAAATRAETAGIHVVMDRCIQVEHARLLRH